MHDHLAMAVLVVSQLARSALPDAPVVIHRRRSARRFLVSVVRRTTP
jgi:hypothetical protein